MRKEIKKSGIDKAFVQEDIAERKQMEKKQSLRLEILKTFHQYGLLKDMCERAVSLIKEYLDCEVVAMRIKEGEDYPYFINNGFTKEFIESENYLCVRDKKGGCLKDSSGCPLLACMCGIIINAEYNQDKLFFTKNGSFWTNSTTELLASITEEDKGTTIRNVCNEYGYESVALIPIKSGSYNIGLLQINDKRRKFFTSDNLGFLEELGHILGIVIERNKAEEEIKNLAKFPSENPYPVLRITKDGTVLYANEAAIPLLNDWGCRVGQSVPKQWRHLIRNTIDTDTRKNIELEYKGNVFSLIVIPVVSAEYVNLYGRDITERKKAEDALRKSEEKYRHFIENLQEGIWAIDKDSYTTFVNPRMTEMLGYTTDEMIGKHLFSFMDKRGVEIAQNLLNRRKGGIKEQHDFEFLRKDGTRLYVTMETAPNFDGKGNYSGAIAGVMDISRRKQAEDELRLSKERYSLAQRAANIGSWDWDIRTGNLEWSEEIEPMFGFGRGEFGGTYEAFLECVHPEDRQHVVDSANACIEKGRDYDIEHRIIWPDGTVCWVSETGNVVRDKNNKAIRMLGVVRDITEHKHADEVLKRDKETFKRLVSEKTHELFKTQAELDKAKRLSDLGTLAATVAHELRNPLGVIKIAAYNIRKKRKNSLLDKHLDNIEKKVSESSQIINNLLSYSRIKIPSYEKIQIYDILNECITFAKRRFHKQNVSIVKKFKLRKKKLIEADPLQIREVFNNILTNACQSVSNKKGKIEISERDDGNGSIEISFKDNGIGIGKEDLERIFEPFFTRKSKGTGLGLTICNELVKLHGGKIDIKSKKGKGTGVTVSLPIKREAK